MTHVCQPVKLHSVYENEVSLGAQGWRLLLATGAANNTCLPVAKQFQVSISQQVQSHRLTSLKKILYSLSLAFEKSSEPEGPNED